MPNIQIRGKKIVIFWKEDCKNVRCIDVKNNEKMQKGIVRRNP